MNPEGLSPCDATSCDAELLKSPRLENVGDVFEIMPNLNACPWEMGQLSGLEVGATDLLQVSSVHSNP